MPVQAITQKRITALIELAGFLTKALAKPVDASAKLKDNAVSCLETVAAWLDKVDTNSDIIASEHYEQLAKAYIQLTQLETSMASIVSDLTGRDTLQTFATQICDQLVKYLNKKLPNNDFLEDRELTDIEREWPKLAQCYCDYLNQFDQNQLQSECHGFGDIFPNTKELSQYTNDELNQLRRKLKYRAIELIVGKLITEDQFKLFNINCDELIASLKPYSIEECEDCCTLIATAMTNDEDITDEKIIALRQWLAAFEKKPTIYGKFQAIPEKYKVLTEAGLSAGLLPIVPANFPFFLGYKDFGECDPLIEVCLAKDSAALPKAPNIDAATAFIDYVTLDDLCEQLVSQFIRQNDPRYSEEDLKRCQRFYEQAGIMNIVDQFKTAAETERFCTYYAFRYGFDIDCCAAVFKASIDRLTVLQPAVYTEPLQLCREIFRYPDSIHKTFCGERLHHFHSAIAQSISVILQYVQIPRSAEVTKITEATAKLKQLHEGVILSFDEVLKLDEIACNFFSLPNNTPSQTESVVINAMMALAAADKSSQATALSNLKKIWAKRRDLQDMITDDFIAALALPDNASPAVVNHVSGFVKAIDDEMAKYCKGEVSYDQKDKKINNAQLARSISQIAKQCKQDVQDQEPSASVCEIVCEIIGRVLETIFAVSTLGLGYAVAGCCNYSLRVFDFSAIRSRQGKYDTEQAESRIGEISRGMGIIPQPS